MADNNKNDAMENLFKAIDIITAERLQNLGYDKTIKATIIDDSKSAHGQYELTDGSSTFTAYAADVLYKKDMTVYVIIPEGDYNNQLLIVGKCSNKGDAYYNYANPSDDFLDVTHNLLVDVHKGEMVANYPEHNYIKLWSMDKVDYKGYNRLALKASFRTWLTPLEVINGTYGLLLYVVSKETSYSGNDFERTYKFDLLTTDMYGDPFNFETYYLQEKVFDISHIPNIVSMELLLVQNCDFKNHNQELVPYLNEKNELLPANIFCESPYVALGYDLTDVQEDSVKLYTLDSESYDATYDTGNIQKTAHVRWVHIQEDGAVVAIDKEDEIPDNAIIHWYKHVLDRTVVDKLAGTFWAEIPEARNKFSYSFVPDILVANEKLKVVIESPSRESVITSLETSLFGDFKGIKIDTDPETGADRTDEAILKLALKSYNDNSLLSLQEYKQIIVEYNETYKVDNQTDYPNYGAAISILDNIMRAQSDICIYKSETLVFENESYDPVAASIDLISALTILVDAAGYNGSYLLYNDSGLIANPAESAKRRILTATYNSLITGEEVLDKAEKIVWYFPIEGSMIQPPQPNVEYTEFDVYTELTQEEITTLELPCKYCRIERAIPELLEGEAGDEIARQTEQVFRVKDYYTQTATNNTIYCSVFKNGREYKAAADLVFGVSGTNGTDATFLLKMYEVDENNVPTNEPASALTIGKTIAIVPKFFDYNNNDITDEYVSKNYVSYNWEMEDRTGRGITLTKPGVGATHRYALLSISSGKTIEQCRYHILSAEIKWSIVKYKKDDWGKVELDPTTGQPIPDETETHDLKTREVDLKTLLPIPVRTNDKFTQVVGPTQIIYDKNGTNPTYYGVPFKIYENGEVNEDANWMGMCEEYLRTRDTRCLNYYPALNSEGKLTPPDMYFATERPYAVDALVGGEIVWTQPILIIQNRYASPMLNSWDGSLTIDKENGTIMSTMVGAGIKDDNNTFSGVLMGDVAAGADFNEDNHSGLGLYGFLKGEQSFGFNVNGTAFIGRSGRGRINFDGDKGTIQSGVYEQYVAGMQIDLDGPDTTSAALYAYGGGGSLELNTDPDSDLFVIRSGPGENSNILFYIGRSDNREFYMQSDNYEEGSTGTNINLYDGTISIYKENGSYVLLDGEGSPYFQIHDGDSDKDIFIAGDSQFQLESTNFETGVSGIFIDLQAGEFEARAGIIGGWTIEQDRITAKSVILDSAGNLSGGSTYQWSILEDGTATFKYLVSEEGGIIGPFTVSKDALYISGGTFEGSTVYLGTGGISVNNKAFSASASGDVYISGNLEVCGTSKLSGGLEVGTGDGSGGAIYSGGSGGKGFYNFGVDEANIGPWKIDKEAISTETGSQLRAEGEIILTNKSSTFKITATSGLEFTSPDNATFKINQGLEYENDQGKFTVKSNYARIATGDGKASLSLNNATVYLGGGLGGGADSSVGYIQINSAGVHIVGGGGGQGYHLDLNKDKAELGVNRGTAMIELTADNLMIDGHVCKKDQVVKIRRLFSAKTTLTFHKGLLISDLGDDDGSGDSGPVEIDEDLKVSGSIWAYEPGTKKLTTLGKLAFMDEVVVSSANFSLGTVQKSTVSGNTATYTVNIPGQAYTAGGSGSKTVYAYKNAEGDVYVSTSSSPKTGYSLADYTTVTAGSSGSGTTKDRTLTVTLTLGAQKGK